MTSPDKPTWQISQRMMPPGDVPPDHPFQRTELDFCDHVVFRLESGSPVYCGLKRTQHPIEVRSTPAWQKWADQ